MRRRVLVGALVFGAVTRLGADVHDVGGGAAPATQRLQAPVLILVYGGADSNGFGNFNLCDGARLCHRSDVGVVFNITRLVEPDPRESARDRFAKAP
jgi:hypothetical protein